MKLIVNADDFGLTKGVSQGILDAMEKGIVTETTAMTNGLYFDEAMREAKERGIFNIGIHLTLTWGKPILAKEEVPSLVNDKGEFLKRNEPRNPNYKELKKEVKAQMEKFLSYGVKPTHIDGHHHFFGFDEKTLEVVIDLAKEYELPLRSLDEKSRVYYKERGIKTPQAFNADFYGENLTKEKFLKILEKYEEVSSLEVMTHPAHVDEDLMEATSYNSERKAEFDILTCEEIKGFIKEKGIELIGFNNILEASSLPTSISGSCPA